MAKKTKSFLVLTTIWSIQHGQYFYPGETVTFDMSTENVPDLPLLLAEKVLEPITEVSDATNKSSSTDS